MKIGASAVPQSTHASQPALQWVRTLSFDPWNGQVLYHLGLTQLQLGRFDDAMATFRQADQFDTPPVSRWTWLLGAGMY